MELSSPGAGHAVNWPDTAILGEVRCRLRMPVLSQDHERTGLDGAAYRIVHLGDRRFRALYGERARRVGKVVLDVDHDERRGRVEEVRALHERG
jgi:hypothetical protein